MRSILTLVSAMFCKGAVISVCSTGCVTTSLQAAFDALAACGDTIQIKSTEIQSGNYTITYRNCAANPITVTTDRSAWLPPNGGRVSPSQLGNMARISTPNANPALKGVLDGSKRPPAGWKFIGIAFTTTTGAATYSLVGFNQDGEATSANQIADNITFDRCYFGNPTSVVTDGAPGIQDVIRADATNLTVKNSFFGDAFWNGFVESHAIRALTNPGPFTVTNTFITTSSIPIFTGGATPSYPAYLENGLTAQYNYFWRPWKWNGDPAQPFAADYVTAAQGTLRQSSGVLGPITNVTDTGVITIPSAPFLGPFSLLTITGVGGCTVANAALWRISLVSNTTFRLLNFPGCNSAYTSGGTINEYAITVCTKNLGELKFGTGINWQYNAAENSWNAYQCQSQFNGLTDTIRTEWNTSINNAAIGTFAMSDPTHITWTGTYRIGDISSGATSSDVGDLATCISLPTTGTECHKVASYLGASLISSTAFSAAPAGPLNGWISYSGAAKLENTIISHNVWKNVDQGYTVLGLSFANGVGDAGFGKNHSVTQNLWYADTSYITGYHAIQVGAAEADYRVNPSNYLFDHNTFYYPNAMGGPFVYAGGQGYGGDCKTLIQPKFDASAITNNLFGVSSAGGNGPFSGDGVGTVIDTANAYFSNMNIKNNVIPGGVNGSLSLIGGNAVFGNIYSAWSDPFGGLAPSRIFNVVPGATSLYHTGTDGASIGVDFTALPLVNNVTVSPAVGFASLQFDVSAPIKDVKNTQPCVLEVSTSRNLVSDLGSYSVIADVDPTMTMGADSSLRSDVILVGSHVTWPLKGLSVGTTYYGRLMCYGDTQWFTFVGSVGDTSVTVTVRGKSAISGKAVMH